ncbi:hypothetical protein D3C71_1899210 [compost metagenome]
MFQQPAAGIGECHAPAGADQQGFAQLGLQRAHLAAQGRLGDIEQQRGLAETAGFGHMHKSFYLLEIHDALKV